MCKAILWQNNVKIGKIIIDDKFKLRVNTGDHSNLYMFTMSFLFAAGLSVCMMIGKGRKINNTAKKGVPTLPFLSRKEES